MRFIILTSTKSKHMNKEIIALNLVVCMQYKHTRCEKTQLQKDVKGDKGNKLKGIVLYFLHVGYNCSEGLIQLFVKLCFTEQRTKKWLDFMYNVFSCIVYLDTHQNIDTCQ